MHFEPNLKFRLAVVMACHNRKETTLRCLEHLLAQLQPLPPATFDLSLFLLDDGSSDGTASAVSALWANARILRGNGKHYWCGGMRIAWSEACKTNPDYFLLLNDDTLLVPHALRSLFNIARGPDLPVIAVSSIADPDTGKVVFGGRRGSNAAIVGVQGAPEDCDTMNANCVLVPRAVVKRIGIFHNRYTHAMGDFDYGFTARRAGIRVVASGEILGTSKPNPEICTWRDTSLPRTERLRLLWFSPKGLPFIEWTIYARRNLGWSWPYRVLSPAFRVVVGR
jgi:GT2 family glycosyltransferase